MGWPRRRRLRSAPWIERKVWSLQRHNFPLDPSGTGTVRHRAPRGLGRGGRPPSPAEPTTLRPGAQAGAGRGAGGSAGAGGRRGAPRGAAPGADPERRLGAQAAAGTFFGAARFLRGAAGSTISARKPAGVRAGHRRHLLRRALRHQRAALLAALGAEVDDAVGGLDHVEVVLDHHHGVALVHQPLQHLEQPLHVREVQPRGGLVEDVERASGGDLGQLARPASRAGPRRRTAWWRAGPAGCSRAPRRAAPGAGA